LEGDDDKIARSDRGDPVAHFKHSRNAFVPEGKRAGERGQRPAEQGDVEIAGGDSQWLDDGLARTVEHRVGSFLPLNLARPEEDEMAHCPS
jgi:hypothetical protein